MSNCSSWFSQIVCFFWLKVFFHSHLTEVDCSSEKLDCINRNGLLRKKFHKFRYCWNLSPIFFRNYSRWCWYTTKYAAVIENLSLRAMQVSIFGEQSKNTCGIFSSISQYIDYMRTLFFLCSFFVFLSLFAWAKQMVAIVLGLPLEVEQNKNRHNTKYDSVCDAKKKEKKTMRTHSLSSEHNNGAFR